MTQGYRLAPQQRRLWSWRQNQPLFPGQLIAVFALEGELQPARWRQAFEQVLARYEILRTALATTPGLREPFQVIEATPVYAWHEAEGPAAAEERPAFARALLEPTDDPHPAVALYRCDAQTALAALRLPAHQADAPTLALLLTAWAETYAGGGEQQPVQFVEVSEWLLDLAASEAAQAGKAFWRDGAAQLALGGEPEPPPSRGYCAQLEALPLPGTAGCGRARVQALALAVWLLLQARLEDKAAIATGVWVDGRPDQELATVLGPLARVLPLALALDPEQRFDQLAASLAAKLEDLALWQACFAWDELELGARGPWLPWSFALTEALAPCAAGPALLRPLCTSLVHEPFSLRLELCQHQEQWQASLSYDRDRFTHQQAQLLAARFRHLFEQAVHRPQLRLAQAELLPPAEARALLTALSGPALAPLPERDVVSAFSAQARRVPAAAALISASQTVSYHQLAEQASALASALYHRGIRAEDRVGLLLDLAPETYAALIAILQVGAVFVPLDPELPAERLRFLVADAGLTLVLTQATQPAALRDCRVASAAIDALAAAPGALFPPPAAEQGAYLIYTSGSTGLPKGILVAHGPLRDHVAAACDFFQIGAGDRVLQMTHLGFDPAQEQIWTALTSGAALVPGRPKQWDPQQLRDHCARWDVTHANWTTSYWHHLVQSWTREPVTPTLPLRHAVIGGETMDPAMAQLWRAHWPHCRLINAYGPTEAIVTACAAVIQAELADPLPVGTPLGARNASLLDRAGQLVAPGTPGQLALGGPLLARGYLGRPRLTAAVFQPDPWSDLPGARRYLSGDRALFAQGQLRFLGRRDHQVKIRGFRVELGELERGLARLAAIDEVAVIARKRSQGDLELLAFFTARGELRPSAAQLRAELASFLPEHMLPALFQQLEAFPRTSGGKLDRGALAALPLRPQNTAETRVFGSPQVQLLGAIWCELLGLSEVQPTAHFFELGGHSLLAIQLVSRIRAALGLHFPLETVFKTPLFGEMAEQLEQQRQLNLGLRRPPLQAGPRPDRVPLSFAQQRLYLAIALQPANDAYHVPMALAIAGGLDAAVLERAFQALLARHESLRTRIRLEADLPVQELGPLDWRLTLVDGAALDQADRARLTDQFGRASALRPFDLARGPLYRAQLLRLGAQEAVLCLTLHHITCDGWSLEVLSRDLAQLYAAFAAGQPSPLAPLPIQVADYALWQQQYYRDGALARELAYWRQQLADLPAPLPLPKSGIGTTRAGRLNLELGPELTRACTRLARSREVTLFMLLLAAFDVLLLHHTGQTDLIVGTDTANRDAEPLEGLIAFFINQLVLRVSLADDPSFSELLARVRATTLAAFEHGEVPFDTLVEDLNPPRDAQLSPFFQVKLVLVNTPRHDYRLPGLHFKALPTAERDTKLDLQLNLWEQDGALRGQLRYKRDLFDPAFIQTMADGFKALLASVVEQPDQALSQLRDQLTTHQSAAQAHHRSQTRDKIKDKLALLKR